MNDFCYKFYSLTHSQGHDEKLGHLGLTLTC